MNKLLEYKIFCLESYKSIHHLSGQEALQTFQKFNIFSYIARYYDILHTTGRLYVVQDIDEYIDSQYCKKKVKKSRVS